MKKEKLSTNAKRLERPPNDDALVAHYANSLGWVGDRDSHHYSTDSNCCSPLHEGAKITMSSAYASTLM